MRIVGLSGFAKLCLGAVAKPDRPNPFLWSLSGDSSAYSIAQNLAKQNFMSGY